MKKFLGSFSGLVLLLVTLGTMHAINLSGWAPRFFEAELFDFDKFLLSVIVVMWSLIIGQWLFYKPLSTIWQRFSPTPRYNAAETYLVIALCHFCSLVMVGMVLGLAKLAWIIAAFFVFSASCTAGFAAAIVYHILVFRTIYEDNPSEAEIANTKRKMASAHAPYFWRSRLAYVVAPITFVVVGELSVGILAMASDRYFDANYFTLSRFSWGIATIVALILMGAFLNLFGRPIAHSLLPDFVPYRFKEAIGYGLGFTVILLFGVTFVDNWGAKTEFGPFTVDTMILAIMVVMSYAWIASAIFGWMRREVPIASDDLPETGLAAS